MSPLAKFKTKGELGEIRKELWFGRNRKLKSIKMYKEMYADLPLRFQKKIDNDLQYLIKSQIPGLRKVFLFGSCARGEVKSTSDVDLLILTETRITDRLLAADVRWTLDEAIDGVRTDVTYTHEGAELSSRVFKKEVDRDKKLILEVV